MTPEPTKEHLELMQDPNVDHVIGYPDKTMIVLDADQYLQLKGQLAELKVALREAVEIIKTWHNMDSERILTPTEQEQMWTIYLNNSPEMKPIVALLKKDAQE